MVFWRNGYGATSVQELVDQTGANRFGLYQLFGDKHALFLKVLDHYWQRFVAPGVDALAREPDGLTGIRNYLRLVYDTVTASPRDHGCLLQLAALEMGQHDSDVFHKANHYAEQVRLALVAAMKRAAADTGTTIVDPESRANYLFAVIQGMDVLARRGGGRAQLKSVYETVDAELASWRPASIAA